MSNGHARFTLPLLTLPPQDRYGNIDPLSIAYACQPRLRPRLTLRGLTLRRKPQVFGGRVFHTSDATHADILTSLRSTVRSRDDFTAKGTLPYPFFPTNREESHSFGDRLKPRWIFGAAPLNQ
jgi:hypothetical protein